jgi:hypothetical protein
VPILLTGALAGYSPNNHLEGATEAEYAPFVAKAREQGQPIFDTVLETPFRRPVIEDPVPVYRSLLDRVEDDLSFFAFHPNAPGEVEVIEPETAHVRTDEYRLFGSEDFRRWLSELGFELTAMRSLRQELRESA